MNKDSILKNLEKIKNQNDFKAKDVLMDFFNGSVFNFVSLPFHLIPEAGCGQNPQSLENTGNSDI